MEASTVTPLFFNSSRICEDILLRLYIQSGERLIHQHQLSFLRQGAGDEHALLLSPRELADLAPGKRRQSNQLERLRTSSQSLACGQRNSPILPMRPIITTSLTLTGNCQSTWLRCGSRRCRYAARG